MKMVLAAAWKCAGVVALLAAITDAYVVSDGATTAAPKATTAAPKATTAAPAAAKAGPALIPTDLLAITARFKLMQERITKLQTQASGVVKLIGDVENAGSDTLKRVASAESNLVNTSNRAAVNQAKILDLKNQTEQAEAKVKQVLAEMTGLTKIVEKLDSTSMSMGSQATKVAGEVADLEDKVRRLMPGSSGLTQRMAKEKSEIEAYQKEVDKGLGGIIEKSLRGHFKKATARVQRLAEDTEANNVDA